jgi:uncharacterized protein
MPERELKRVPAEAPPLDEIVERIVQHCRPRRILLFGSRARGDHHDDSDVDLLIEMDTDLRKPFREVEIHKLFPERAWSMDVFVYTPEEIAERKPNVGTLVHMAEKEGRVLYDRR